MIQTASLRQEMSQGPMSVVRKRRPLMRRIIDHPPIRDAEKILYTQRRIVKAERDERTDITKALTPVKTYVHTAPVLYSPLTIHV